MAFVEEGSIKLRLVVPKVVSKGMSTFYNPVMKKNRDISVLLLKALGKKRLRIALPLAGSGIRGLRFLKELKGGIVKQVAFNDYDPKFKKKLEGSFKLNDLKVSRRTDISTKEASLFLLESKGFDYIDIDPFGSPNPFLDAACKKVSRGGILAVTATDTAALAGTYPSTCRWKYWARPLRGHLKHEFGLRILARKVQLVGAQYEKALVPVFSHANDHYMRIYFLCEKSKKKAYQVVYSHWERFGRGPVWTGQLWDADLARKMRDLCEDDRLGKFLDVIAQEAKLEFPFFHDIHKLCKKLGQPIPPFKDIFQEVRKKHSASPTHFSDKGIKTDMDEKGVMQVLARLHRRASKRK